MEAKTYQRRFQDKERAARYSKRFEHGSRKRTDLREQKAVARIFAALKDCQSVLDVPCGAGRFAATLGKGDRLLIESDVAHEMVDIARQHGRQLGVRARWIQSDAGRLPVRDGAVDCIFCNRLLHHILPVDERAMFLKEFRRVTRRWLVLTFFDYQVFGPVRKALKTLKGRKPLYAAQPTFKQFEAELTAAGFCVRNVVPTGPVWVSEKYLVLEKSR